MASTSDLRDKVEFKLHDTGQEVWQSTDIDAAVLDGVQAIYPTVYSAALSSEMNWADGSNSVVLGNDEDSKPALNIQEVEVDCPYVKGWIKIKSFNHVIGSIVFRSNNETGAVIKVRAFYKGRYTLSSLPPLLEDAVACYAAGRCCENRLGLRLRYDEIPVDGDITAATTGDLVGAAGYFMFQFRLLVEQNATDKDKKEEAQAQSSAQSGRKKR